MQITIAQRRLLTAVAVVTVAVLVPLLTCGAQVAGGEKHHAGQATLIPQSMREEHAAIHSELMYATSVKGRVGVAARALAKVLQPHFEREEEIALPPLGLLVPLSRGERPAGMLAVLPMTDSLRAELPQMLAEHVEIRAATTRLEAVARAAGNTRVVRLTHELALHARSEEEMFYPMAILVGDLVRARIATASSR